MQPLLTMLGVFMRKDWKDVGMLASNLGIPLFWLTFLEQTIPTGIPQPYQATVKLSLAVAVILISSAFSGIFIGSLHIAQWRLDGLIDVLRYAPISLVTMLAAQAISGVFVTLVQTLELAAFSSLFDVHFTWHDLLALPIIVLMYGVFFCIGVLLGSLLNSLNGVAMSAVAVVIISGMLGGGMIPADLMPTWIVRLGEVLPMHHGLQLLQRIVLDGSWISFSSVSLWYSVIALLLLAAGSIWLFKERCRIR